MIQQRIYGRSQQDESNPEDDANRSPGMNSPFLFSPPREKNQPNVLFIAADDLQDWVRHLGGENKTPDAVTLRQHFRASAYSTRGGGKIFHGTSAYDKDSWVFSFKPSSSKKHHTKHDTRFLKSGWVPWGPLDCRDEDIFDGKVASWIITELEKPQAKPLRRPPPRNPKALSPKRKSHRHRHRLTPLPRP
jgi:hypothetical protein